MKNYILDGIPRDVIYVSFDFVSKPIYLTNLESAGGECWSIVGVDLSLPKSWVTLALDNIHSQMNSSTTNLMSQRFVLHAIRTGQYTLTQFRNDILSRDAVNIDL